MRHEEDLGPLFASVRARARNSDPATSHIAAGNIECEGRAASQRRLCLAEVRRQPGQTAAEIATAVGLERHVPSRRLPELRQAGFVENGTVRVCTIQKSLSMTWNPKRGEGQES